MASGLKFVFGNSPDFMLVDSVMDGLFPQQYSQGKIDVVVGETVIGQAGKITGDQIKSIAKGADVSFSGQFNQTEQLHLLKEARLVNADVDPTGVKQAVHVFGAEFV